MRFRVTVLPRAEQDIAETYAFIADVQQQPLVAARWVDGVEEAIRSLGSLPHRGVVSREQEFLGADPPVQQFLFHKHRILYTVTGDHVRVLHVRRGSRQDVRRGEL
jgi:plasmid stabilization system protein ParE